MMKIDETVDTWIMLEIRETLLHLNDVLRRKGQKPQSLDWNTVSARFGLTDPIMCSEGHADCLESRPSTLAIIIRARTHEGTPLLKVKPLIGETPAGLLHAILDGSELDNQINS